MKKCYSHSTSDVLNEVEPDVLTQHQCSATSSRRYYDPACLSVCWLVCLSMMLIASSPFWKTKSANFIKLALQYNPVLFCPHLQACFFNWTRFTFSYFAHYSSFIVAKQPCFYIYLHLHRCLVA